MLNHRSYGAESVLNEGLGKHQGPALAIFFDKALEPEEVMEFQNIDKELAAVGMVIMGVL